MNTCKKQFKKLKREKRRLESKFNTKLLKYITAGFSVAAGFAWKDAIEDLIDYFFPQTKQGILAKIIYAFVLTLILVVVSLYLSKILHKKRKKKSK
ncbi:hypothetical protein CL633_01185 [bacterium]|nr:hypothetical protein [bacterium]|tara:strand:+ start:1890 stop:2177 length:288 start_codon:yes stop_codon:yes gene_type:complete